MEPPWSEEEHEDVHDPGFQVAGHVGDHVHEYEFDFVHVNGRYECVYCVVH